MTVFRHTKKVLTMLLSVGVLGISSVLAAVHTKPLPIDVKGGRSTSNVAERLREIRTGLSEIEGTENKNLSSGVMLTAWPNGWRNGGWGWRNGGWGWHNGGWHNGWHNGGWGNGGWGNGGWHNWHNFWNNW